MMSATYVFQPFPVRCRLTSVIALIIFFLLFVLLVLVNTELSLLIITLEA